MDGPPVGELRTHLFLAESAQLTGGKLYVLGGAICGLTSALGAGVLLAICGTVEAPWEQNNRPHELNIALLGHDNGAYMVPTPNGAQPFQISAKFTSAVPAQLPRGSSSAGPFAVQFALPVTAHGTFFFLVRVDGNETQRLPFFLGPP